MKLGQDIPLSYEIQSVSGEFCYLSIKIAAEYIDALYKTVSHTQQDFVATYGFGQKTTPVEYIQEHYKSTLLDHVTEFVFKYFVVNFLYEVIEQEKLTLSGEPRLQRTHVEPGQDALFVFEVSLAKPIELREWKHFLFKAPKRKNYKDIDRQVEGFMQEESEEKVAKDQKGRVHVGDWVCFDITLLLNKNPFCGTHTKNAWIKVGSEEVDMPFQELFLGKKISDSFNSNAQVLQDYFSNSINSKYDFFIIIRDIVPAHNFCFDDFKHHFKLKTQKDVHQKLIEIFSYRNDLSQRRSIVEEAMKLLLSKHQIDIPNQLILRQQKLILESLQSNPDYQVYKTDKNFKDNVKQLAVKQAKEMLLLDQLSHQENIKVTDKDFRGYLNLLKRPRTKEFIYFNPPPTKIDGQEMPLPSALLKRCCLREKTLNHVIYHLTKK